MQSEETQSEPCETEIHEADCTCAFCRSRLPAPLLFPGAEPIPKKKPPKPKLLTLSEALASSPDFLAFWTAYPRKGGGVDAFKAWGQTDGIRPPLPSLLADLQRQVATAWAGKATEYVPLPGTWLRGQKWLDASPGMVQAPARASPSTSPAVDVEALKRSVQADVGNHLRRHGIHQPQLGEILSALDDLNEEHALREWAEGTTRRWSS